MRSGHSGWLRRTLLAIVAGVFPAHAAAQTAPAHVWTPEVSGGIGIGHVFRYADDSFGDEPNISGAVAVLRRNGIGLELEANTTIGLTPKPAACGIVIDGVPATCSGSAREGVLDASSVSFNFRYQLMRHRLQPYFMAGLGVLRTRAVASITMVRNGTAVQTETEDTSTGIGPDVGAGLRIPLAGGISVNPEIRWLEAASLSRHNLAVTRMSIRAAFAW